MKVGVLLTDPPHTLFTLISLLSGEVEVVDGSGGGCEWYLVADPAAAPRGARVLHWAGDGEPLGADVTLVPADSRAASLASEDGTRGLAAHPIVIPVPVHVAPGYARAMLPFTRARLRRAYGLPAEIGRARPDGWSWGTTDVSAELADTVCGAAAAVVATGVEHALRALAWAAPLVTDSATAIDLGLEDEVHCLVRDDHAFRVVTAHAVAQDPVRASRLAWRGRCRVEVRHLPAESCRALVAHLDPHPERDVRILGRHLQRLGTPMDAVVRQRVARVVAP